MNSVELERLASLDKERKKLDRMINLIETEEKLGFFVAKGDYCQSEDKIDGPSDFQSDLKRSMLGILLTRRDEVAQDLMDGGVDI